MGKPEWEWFSNPIWEQIRECQDVFAGVFAYGRWRFNSPQAEKRGTCRATTYPCSCLKPWEFTRHSAGR